MIDKNIALQLYNEGYTLQAIGDKFGVSRQRINQVINHTYNGKNYRHGKINPYPNTSEQIVANKLRELGYTVEFTPQGYLYDLILNNKIKVEVKHSNKAQDGYHRFSYVMSQRFDVIILLCGNINNPTFYVIPANECPTFISIPVAPLSNTRRQRRHKDGWKLIKALDK